MLSNRYQYALIALGLVGTFLFTYFFYKEIFPEYRIYQDDYIELEKFRSTYTGEAPPPFKTGIKQIVIEREDKGPATIDRCISCHVALQLPHFSPTKIAKDINGNTVLDDAGNPVQIPNDEYVWNRLELEIQKLRNNGDNRAADKLEALKTADVSGAIYDVTKVLRAHPLMGRETVPFQYHPIDEYGCVSCHNGNGRGLVTDRAHGPVFDETYETEYRGFIPQFLEKDEKHDPKFSRVFNDKPGHRLLFQTSPLYVGALIQAKCVQCHLTSQEDGDLRNQSTDASIKIRENEVKALKAGYDRDKKALLSLITLEKSLDSKGYDNTLKEIQAKTTNYSYLPSDIDAFSSQLRFLKANAKDAKQAIQKEIVALVGPISVKDVNAENIDKFLSDNEASAKSGTLFQKATQMQFEQAIIQHVKDLREGIEPQSNVKTFETDVDRLTEDYQRGRELFVSQACYACHRISGYARGGVGPELTKEGNSYPWFVKESIVWPQADLKTSTMPNAKLDHDEVEALVTFLLAQKGEKPALNGQAYKTKIMRWEAGEKQPWERPIPPSDLHNLDYSMTVFATEGCASCHRLKGYESEMGFAIEKDKASFESLLKESEWFKKLFPEEVVGSQIVKAIDQHGEEIDKRIARVRDKKILEKIEENHPGLIEAFYSPFKFASRAKDGDVKDAELKVYKERLHKVLMIYIKEYGLGRLIGPRPNWSGVYRTDEWLMEHFKAPTAHIPRSIMPVMPFDDTKFYALTYMLDVLGKKNRDELRQLWDLKGFKPDQAYETLCAQCHGPYLQGNGPIAEWIYPPPKNLRKTDFLPNLTKERTKFSLKHGVKGTPMPPWGEAAMDKTTADGIPVLNDKEIEKLADWLFSILPGAEGTLTPSEVPKWEYGPDEIMQDLKNEGQKLKKKPALSSYFPKARNLIAANGPTQTAEPDENAIFEKVKSPLNGPDPYYYYIKKEYYTPENIEAGRQFFYENCAVCHGKEGDGAGARAEAMFDAKPRMFINLDWINFRDDVRLIRSIKFGVPGTSMVAWGDQTSALQRLQLVIFIRTLTQNANARRSLLEGVYQIFDVQDQNVERARISISKEIANLQEQYAGILSLTKESERKAPEEAVNDYKKSLEIRSKIEKAKDKDALFVDLKGRIKESKETFIQLGSQILLLSNMDVFLPLYINWLDTGKSQIIWDKDRLVFKGIGDDKGQKAFLDAIGKAIKKIESEIELEKGKIESAQSEKNIRELELKLAALKKLDKSTRQASSQIEKLSQNEKELIEKIYGNSNEHTANGL